MVFDDFIVEFNLSTTEKTCIEVDFLEQRKVLVI